MTSHIDSSCGTHGSENEKEEVDKEETMSCHSQNKAGLDEESICKQGEGEGEETIPISMHSQHSMYKVDLDEKSIRRHILQAGMSDAGE